jgi:hypothetical protein
VSQYEPEYADFEPYTGDTSYVDPNDLAAIAQSAGEFGAQKALAEIAQGLQQTQAQQAQQQAGQTLQAAERAITELDPTWPARAGHAYDVFNMHPTMVDPAIAWDVEVAADSLQRAARLGQEMEADHQKQAMAAYDEGAFRKIKAQASKSWSSRMSDAGTSVHDILDS